jgi:Holliday junction resolvasome RuvABC endonuclease subunit
VVWQTSSFHPGPQYEVARFDDVPAIETILIDHTDKPPLGAGEPAIGTMGGAIGNAIFAATGKRLRTLPFTPDRVKAALAGAGKITSSLTTTLTTTTPPKDSHGHTSATF